MKKISLLFYLLTLCVGLYATNPSSSYREEAIEQRDFDEAAWQKIISGIDYSKDLKPEEKKPKEKKETEQKSSDWQSPLDFYDSFGRPLFIGLVVVLGTLLLVYVIRFLLAPSKNKRLPNTAKEMEVSVEEVAENLATHDPSDLIAQAILLANYRVAVRLYYLKTIRELSLKEAITWQRDKTNQSYLEEMQGHSLHASFQDITGIFERIWYGNRTLNANDFEQIRPKAEHLLAQIAALSNKTTQP